MLLRKLSNFGIKLTSVTMCSVLLSACAHTSAQVSEVFETETETVTLQSSTDFDEKAIQSEEVPTQVSSLTDTDNDSIADNSDCISSDIAITEEESIEESSILIETSTDEEFFETLTEEEVPTAIMKSDGFRDNTPVCYVPVATGSVVYGNSLAEIDASNLSEGYVMVNYKGVNPKVKLQITGSNGVTYTYNLQNGYETFPLSAGSGSYKISVYENVTGNQYATALSQTITANITNPFGAYLYPNQYVKFNAGNMVVSKAMQLAESCGSDLDVVTKVYNYVSTITYDHAKAASVQSGYTPNVDLILQSGTGICLDYASVMASMLRSQNIPTRLEVGYAGTAYHAWISTYITDIGWVNGIIQFDGANWSLMDPTFAANSSEAALKNFIGDGTNYKTKYIY